MQKPDTETLREAVQQFGEAELSSVPEEIRTRIENQVFRMMTDLPEEDWARNSDVELSWLCAYLAHDVIKYIITAQRIERMLKMFGFEPDTKIDVLPSEQYPDRNFYEVIDEVIEKARDSGLPTETPSPLVGKFPSPPTEGVHGEKIESSDLENLDFSGGFSA